MEFKVVLLRAAMKRLAQRFRATEEYTHLALLWGVCLCQLSKDLVKVGPSIIRW